MLNQSFLVVSCTKVGSMIFEKCIEAASRKQKSFIVQNVLDNLDCLIKDQYGNILIENILSLKDQQVNSKIADKISSKLIEYSTSQISASLIEKVYQII